MSVDAMSNIQARIASIQQRFSVAAPTAALGETSLAAGSSDFAALLSEAQSDFSPTAASTSNPTSTATSTIAVGGKTQAFVDEALRQTGDEYVWGSSAPASNADPSAFDCSELVKWAAGRVGVNVPDGSWLQYLDLKEKGALIPVEQALKTPGALLFKFDEEPKPGGGRPGSAHVAISLGDGRTIEARGREYGVGSWEAGDRFQYGAVIPGMN